ncbi:conserved hypothetical protein [Allorhizobium ampelinum S4]|uniref:DUF1003 domain-containing protein n=2 Tax=Rhizobium/Agrobacterium group TaxID=227290 RepID=B9K2Y4_ALLAM|nr:conserved hypothetical protein [Allorhizobium ampelinum S4]
MKLCIRGPGRQFCRARSFLSEPCVSNISPASSHQSHQCCLCHKTVPPRHLHAVNSMRSSLIELIEAQCGPLAADARICDDDLSALRRQRVEKLLQEERGELSDLDRRVIADLGRDVSTVQTAAAEIERPTRFGDRASDAVASFGGSWRFIIIFAVILVTWMAINSIGLFLQPFDPYPYILLNLLLSCVAAMQAPIIMMSQKRQEEKDRQRAENDYMINLRAELEIRQLHEKIDHQMAHQWARLAELQQIQIDLLEGRISKKDI